MPPPCEQEAQSARERLALQRQRLAELQAANRERRQRLAEAQGQQEELKVGALACSCSTSGQQRACCVNFTRSPCCCTPGVTHVHVLNGGTWALVEASRKSNCAVVLSPSLSYAEPV